MITHRYLLACGLVFLGALLSASSARAADPPLIIATAAEGFYKKMVTRLADEIAAHTKLKRTIVRSTEEGALALLRDQQAACAAVTVTSLSKVAARSNHAAPLQTARKLALLQVPMTDEQLDKVLTTPETRDPFYGALDGAGLEIEEFVRIGRLRFIAKQSLASGALGGRRVCVVEGDLVAPTILLQMGAETRVCGPTGLLTHYQKDADAIVSPLLVLEQLGLSAGAPFISQETFGHAVAAVVCRKDFVAALGEARASALRFAIRSTAPNLSRMMLEEEATGATARMVRKGATFTKMEKSAVAGVQCAIARALEPLRSTFETFVDNVWNVGKLPKRCE